MDKRNIDKKRSQEDNRDRLRRWIYSSWLITLIVSIRDTVSAAVCHSQIGHSAHALALRFRQSRVGRRVSGKVTWIVIVAFGFRLLAIPFAAWRINPYSTHDATVFAAFARRIGTSLFAGPVVAGPLFPSPTSVQIFRFWGFLLAPFWVLPGPSWVFAHVGMAALGALAVWNVAAIGRRWHSPAAGVLAAFPVAIYPSFILVHATLLREAAVLLGLTTVARILVVPPERLGQPGRLTLAAVALALTIPLRLENLPVYVVTLAVGGALWYRRHRTVGHRERLIAGSVFAAAVAVGLALAPRIVNYLARLRGYRTRGQSVYLPYVIAETVPQALVFAPIGALYFLFTPFPWMVERVSEAVVFVEAIGNLVFAVAAIPGARYALRRFQPGAGALIVGFLLASLLYGLVEGNVGTAVRHRQMFVWIIYIFGALGLVRWLNEN